METEINNLRRSQSELETITKNYSKREQNLKMKYELLTGKGNIDWYRSENKVLRTQISELNKKSVSIFKELNSILDVLEDAKKKKNQKLKKKGKSILKGKLF